MCLALAVPSIVNSTPNIASICSKHKAQCSKRCMSYFAMFVVCRIGHSNTSGLPCARIMTMHKKGICVKPDIACVNAALNITGIVIIPCRGYVPLVSKGSPLHWWSMETISFKCAIYNGGH